MSENTPTPGPSLTEQGDTGDSHPLSGLPDWFTKREVIPLDDQLALVVCHKDMRRIVALCREVAASGQPVLLTGETGVGKSLLARFIHVERDPYAPFVTMTTAGLEAAALMPAIFGYRHAPQPKPPLIAEAAGGTLVLEEMGDLPRAVQRAVMRAWDHAEAGAEARAGAGAGARAAAPAAANAQAAEEYPALPAQWICTTNQPLRALESPGAMEPGFLGRFRRVHVPPLRERKQDIPAIVAYFSRLKASREASLESLEALSRRLKRHTFPGNVRELESLVSLEAGGLDWQWRIDGPNRGFFLGAGAPSAKRRR